MVQQTCKKHCCMIKFCPLVVEFGRTIHTFQGQESGPGKPIETIVVNPGTKYFEAANPGTLNCCITRATTIGDFQEILSAIYFTGPHINFERFSNMTHAKSGKIYHKVEIRNSWIKYLQMRKKQYEKKRIKFDEELLQTAINKTTISLEQFDSIIQYHVQKMNLYST